MASKGARFEIQKRWFTDKIAARELSQNKVAELIGMGGSNFSRALSGSREMKIPEAMRLAEVLHVAPDDVFERLGIKVAADPSKSVPMRWTVDHSGKLHAHRPTERLPTPPGCEGGTEAARVASDDTSVDGWTVYFGEMESAMPAEIAGRLCVIKVRDEKEMRLGVILPGHKPGRFTVRPAPFLPGDKAANVAVVAAAPVKWIGL